MKKSLVVLCILTLPTLAYSQNSPESVIPRSVLPLNEGIYLSIEDFLTNSPSIPYHVNVYHSISGIYGDENERNEYVLSYYDNMGYRMVHRVCDIWGYCDGNSVYITHQGRPYELVHLGAISLLRYRHSYHRNTLSQILSLYTMIPASDMETVQEVLFHLKTDSVIIPTNRNIRKLISSDTELYTDYSSVKNMDYFQKNLMFLQRYNEKFPVRITSRGIILDESAANPTLVEKN